MLFRSRYFFQVPRSESPRYFPSGPISPWVFRKRATASESVSVAAAGACPDSAGFSTPCLLANWASSFRIRSARCRSASWRLLVLSDPRTRCPLWRPSTWKGQLHLSARTSRPPGPKNGQALRCRRNAYSPLSVFTVSHYLNMARINGLTPSLCASHTPVPRRSARSSLWCSLALPGGRRLAAGECLAQIRRGTTPEPFSR